MIIVCAVLEAVLDVIWHFAFTLSSERMKRAGLRSGGGRQRCYLRGCRSYRAAVRFGVFIGKVVASSLDGCRELEPWRGNISLWIQVRAR
jgi:hypothetical protein